MIVASGSGWKSSQATMTSNENTTPSGRQEQAPAPSDNGSRITVKDLDERLRSLEDFKNRVIGIAIGVGLVMGLAGTLITVAFFLGRATASSG